MSSQGFAGLAGDHFSGSARYVGRVGALAFMLGVGAAIAAMPTAVADTSAPAGVSGSDSAGTGKVSPRRASAVRATIVSDTRQLASDAKTSRLASGGGSGAPVAEPLAWTALAVTRRGLGGGARAAATPTAATTAAATTSSGGPGGAVVASAVAATAQQPVSIFQAGDIYLIVIHDTRHFSKALLRRLTRISEGIARLCRQRAVV